MKYRILVLLMVLCLTSIAQSRLGSSISEIKSEFYELSWDSYPSKNGYTIYRTYIRGNECLYYINERGYCDQFVLYPKTSGALNWYVETYNSRYVVVDNKHWKMYSADNDEVVHIFLFFDSESGRDYFYHASQTFINNMKL